MTDQIAKDPERELVRSGDVTSAQRLFACACCRRIWSLLPEASQRAVEVREQFERGAASETDCAAALADAEAARRVARSASNESVAWAAAAAVNACRGNWAAAAEFAAQAIAAKGSVKYEEERQQQYALYTAKRV